MLPQRAGAVQGIGADGFCLNVSINDHLRLDGNILYNPNTDGVCIRLINGKDLDLNGYSIFCDTNCGTAILADSANSDVTGSGSSSIADDWDIAIQGATTISNLTISGPDVAVLDNGDRLKTISNVDIECSGIEICVDATLPRSTDQIINSEIHQAAGPALRFIGSTSGAGPLIENNDIRSETADAAFQQIGTSKKFRAYNNFVSNNYGVPISVDNISLVSDLSVWRGNYCLDTVYCPPDPTCSNFGHPVCGPDNLPYCTGH